jgi:hypothetical protein
VELTDGCQECSAETFNVGVEKFEGRILAFAPEYQEVVQILTSKGTPEVVVTDEIYCPAPRQDLDQAPHGLSVQILVRLSRDSCARRLDLCVPLVTMSAEFVWCVLCTLRVFKVIRPHVAMTVEAERNAILERVLSTLGLLHDMVQLDLESAEAMANTAVPTTCDESLLLDLRRETHDNVGAIGDSKRFFERRRTLPDRISAAPIASAQRA